MENFMDNIMVEEAPDSMDLDALLGLTDDVSSENGTKREDRVFQVMSKDDIEVEEPHIKIPTAKLIEVLNVSSLISSAGENSFEGKVVAMLVEKGVVRFLLSDNKRNIEKRVDILNKDNQFEGFIAFSTSLLSRLSKVCTSIFTLIERVGVENDKETKKYILAIRGGEVALDLINMNRDKFDKAIDCRDGQDYPSKEIVESIRRLYSYVSTSIRSGKSLDFMGDYIQASPINSLAKIKLSKSYPVFRLSLTDTKILSVLCGKDTSDKVKISRDGKEFVGSNFKFKTESYQTTTPAYDSVVERMFEGECVEIDERHLSQLTDLSCGLDTSVGTLRFNYTDDGLVSCTLLTKREDSNLVVQGNPNEKVSKMDKGVDIPSFGLKGALSVFSSESALLMRVTPDGVSFESDGIKVALLGKQVK